MRLDLWEAKSYYTVGDYKKSKDLTDTHIKTILENTPELKKHNLS